MVEDKEGGHFLIGVSLEILLSELLQGEREVSREGLMQPLRTLCFSSGSRTTLPPLPQKTEYTAPLTQSFLRQVSPFPLNSDLTAQRWDVERFCPSLETPWVSPLGPLRKP